MALVLKTRDSFVWPIKIRTPDNGKYSEEEMKMTFKKLKSSELKTLLEDKGASVSDFCKEVVTGWDQIFNEDKSKVEFSEDKLDLLLEEAGVGTQIMNQYLDALKGVVQKN